MYRGRREERRLNRLTGETDTMFVESIEGRCLIGPYCSKQVIVGSTRRSPFPQQRNLAVNPWFPQASRRTYQHSA